MTKLLAASALALSIALSAAAVPALAGDDVVHATVLFSAIGGTYAPGGRFLCHCFGSRVFPKPTG